MGCFELDKQLLQDCHVLGQLDSSYVLLMDNALFPWFILVPQTMLTEFHHIDAPQQRQLLEQMNRLSEFIEQHFSISKLNTACIGNIVRQLHIHLVGRRETDSCWPGVVWGRAQRQAYPLNEVQRISGLLQQTLGSDFIPFECQPES
jgi:diadenosine tetraphosphate (Ap4A) HIT family hydrolase